jgi:glycosyltransferase involved in cell wall biosynthesis
MHILILSQYYDPEPIPKPVELAQELKLLGHEVSVVTGFPNYPSGQLYPGYKLRFMQKTRLSGINVTRTYEYPYHGKSALGRIINYVSFMISAPFSLFKNRHFDVIYVWHPPLTVGIAAWVISVFSRTPFVYDVQDIWPESVVISGLVNNELVIKIIACIEKFVYRKASSLFVVTKGAGENLIEKGVPEDKISVMPHWIDEKLFLSVDDVEIENLRQEYGFRNRFVVMFAGNLGTVQGLDTIISAAENITDDEKVLIVFVGGGSDESRLKDLVETKNLNGRVCFINRQPIDKIPEYLAAADVLLVHLKSSDLSDYVIPSKTIAYLAAGKPIIMAADGAAAELVEEINAGIIIEPENPSSLAEAIRELSSADQKVLEKMGKNGRDHFLVNFSRSIVIPLYEKALVKVVNQIKY